MAGGARAGLLGLLPAILLALLALPVLGYAAVAQEVPLKADLEHGIVLIDRNVVLYKQGTGPNNLNAAAYLGSDDIERILGWPGDMVYVVIQVYSVDLYGSVPPRVQVNVYSGAVSLGNWLYSSDWKDIPGPGTYEIPIPKTVFQSSAVRQYGARIQLHLIEAWNTDTSSGAPDNRYAVNILKVILAPPKGAYSSGGQAQQPVAVAAEEMRGRVGGLDSRTVVAAAAGAGVALLMVVVYQAARGGRRGR